MQICPRAAGRLLDRGGQPAAPGATSPVQSAQCRALLRRHQRKIAAFWSLFCKTDFVEETDVPLPQIDRIISSFSETAATIADCCDGLALCSARTLRSPGGLCEYGSSYVFYIVYIVTIIETHYLKHIGIESGSFINVLKVMVHQFKKWMHGSG